MENVTDILNGKLLSYGISGFALMMVSLTYYQIRSELNREQPRSIAIKTIWMFMGLVLLSTTVVGFFSVPIASKNDRLSNQVDTLTINMGKMTGLLTNYEYAINELATKLDKKTNPGSTITPISTKPISGLSNTTMLNMEIVGRYIDPKSLSVPKSAGVIKLNDSTRKTIYNNANMKFKKMNILKN